MSRYIMHLVHRKGDGRWHVEEEGGSSIGAFETKDEAEMAGRMRATRLHEDGRDAQLVVHLEDGSIETEYAYGLEPSAMPIVE
ncbi:MAG TPA: DUF2188 domain-containing protein [Dokdonella sp.]|nr:DUF2188 domain-containing protein [Dokdonella sp.]